MSKRGSLLTSRGIARRELRRMLKSPPLSLPVLLFPLLLFGAFSAGLSAFSATPAFDYPDYTTFQFVYVLITAAALSGMQTGLAMAEDFESGFARRILLSTRGRWPVVAGYAAAAQVRACVVFALLFGIGLMAGMEVSGSPVQITAVVLLALLFSFAVTMWSAGFVLRARSLQAGPAFQLPILVLMFLVPVYVTRDLLTSWVKVVADINPITPILEAGRGLMVGQPASVGLAFGVCAGLIAVLLVWVGRSLRAAEAAGGR